LNLGRFSGHHAAPKEAAEESVVEVDPTGLAQVFAAPRWLRDLGLLAWFLVGVGVVLVGIVWLLGITATIVNPVVTGGVVAAVASPVVAWLKRHHVPRAGGAVIVLLGFLVLGVIVLLLVLGGIVEQSAEIKSAASHALDKIEGWANSAGANGTSGAKHDVSNATQGIGSKLLTGVAHGIKGLTSLAFFFSFTLFSIFFLLKDGPSVRRWINHHLGLPAGVATVITGNVLQSMRRYFFGLTIVAAFNGIVVGIAALILGVPLAGTIGVVTFVTAYVPFIGAVVSGAFAVIIALGAKGTAVALIMLVVVILANGALQNIVQPIAFGATLDLNPLVILIVTISAGSLFGMVGLILAAPLTSAAVHISKDLARAKAAALAAGDQPPLDVAPAGPGR